MQENAIDIVTRAHLVVALFAYLLGSIPFGLVLTKLAGLGDIRDIGSGNVGATNVLRTGNKPLALLTLLLDAGKGGIAALIAYHLYPGGDKGIDFAIIAGLAAVIGHNFPLWLRFEGGKGFATTLGTLLAISWQIGLAACVTWALIAAIFRYSSLAALVALAASPFYAWFMGFEKVAVLAALLAILGIFRHQENIRRLLKGEESKIGKKK
ncbi:MAG: glycerol-3-phosphate 1-O-acyltransferase PlsY [Rhodospirillaceae bacterium]|jgi:acyl phosphate:glycerol-3-phosphate acyltransferase|nr:glycerol-3-phosphate 1-O-acyltransferase PlsY [Rhodospirillaceae bacterium]MBT4588766.1 glycerol-3-phosphate 1-O-acyltransferase PlsY [Rhodospirillaceae bacterium]MBT4939919.1 glycerol-3-phosphate 1-O-acyltransferase PlsY [Rhodospirillaceae bacterium]MBT5939506.1 glycerol-3-phosphate 1-O-acyltransferase PlsY [Rhodospirillaceae bacterium]MBT7267763.1 glycerol-3-phosphate 1-O-acyltransferase PlsY [Rhodospirillaceae bacterium]